MVLFVRRGREFILTNFLVMNDSIVILDVDDIEMYLFVRHGGR